MTERPKRYYRPELDALRFFAFMNVFFFHSLPYYTIGAHQHLEVFHLGWVGQWGVPMFFFLSAFLIVELLLRERDTTGRVDLKAFYIRRVLRIWPLYFFAYGAFALLNLWLPGINPHAGKTWPYFVFFGVNWYVSRYGWIGAGVDPLWSISVEEQFYLLIPVITSLGGRKALRIGSAIAIVASYCAIYRYAHVTWKEDSGEWSNSFVQFQFFAGGALLAMLLEGRVPKWGWWARLTACAAGMACWIVAQTEFGVRSYESAATVPQAFVGWPLILAGCALFLLAFLGIRAERVPRWMVYMGRISFGLYVFHYVVYNLVFHYLAGWLWRPDVLTAWWRIYPVWGYVLLVLGITTGLASASYRFLEQPFLRLKERFTVVPSRPE